MFSYVFFSLSLSLSLSLSHEGRNNSGTSRGFFSRIQEYLALKLTTDNKRKGIEGIVKCPFSMGDWCWKSLLLQYRCCCALKIFCRFSVVTAASIGRGSPKFGCEMQAGRTPLFSSLFLFALSLSLFHLGRNNSGTSGGLYSRIRGVSCT